MANEKGGWFKVLSPEEANLQRQQLEKRRQQRRAERRRKVIFYTICVILGVVLLTVTAYWSYYSELPFGLSRGRGQGAIVNVLLLGVDAGMDGAARSDTIILLSVDRRDGSVHAIAIPRDTRVSIPGRRGLERINAAHAHGGPALAVRTVEQLLDVDIDYYVRVDFEGFESIIDTLGGVVIDVEKRMWYEDKAQGLLIDLRPGLQRLSGDQALQYVRYRSDGLGDVSLVDPAEGEYGGRVERQLKLIKAVVNQAFTAKNILNAPQLVSDLRGTVSANIPPDVALNLVMGLSDISPSKIKTAILPGHTETIAGASYWNPDLGKTKEIVNKLILRIPDMVRVEVLNGNGISGAASVVANRLRESGFEVVSVGNADRFDYRTTAVIPRGGHVDEAHRVAEALGAQIHASSESGVERGSSNDADVVVIVGRDMTR